MAAFLILAAIVGFAGGAYLGTQSGSTEPDSSNTATDQPVADETEDEQEDVGADDEAEDEEEPPSGTGVTFALQLSSASPNQRIDYSGRLESGEEGVELQIQRSVDGADWENFPVTRTTGANGDYSGYLQTQRTGENAFRVVRIDDDSVISEPSVVVIQ